MTDHTGVLVMLPGPIEEHLQNHPSFYVSITGLRVRSWRWTMAFWWHAIRAKSQADGAEGILFSAAKEIDGVHHTLTAWKSKEAMRKYVSSGTHAAAVKAFRKIATGKTFGYHSAQLPSWSEVTELWHAQGTER